MRARASPKKASLSFRGTAKSDPVNVHDRGFYVHSLWRHFMSSVRHKHVVLDQRKLDRARRVLGTRTDRETIEKALDVVATDERLSAHLRRLGGTMTLQKV